MDNNPVTQNEGFKERLYEYRLFYSSTPLAPHTMRFELTLTQDIDPMALQLAVDRTMPRYPYFDVALARIKEDYCFVSSGSPLLVRQKKDRAKLGTKNNALHHIAVDYQGKVIGIDFSHFLTDGAGAYHWIKTLLYHYVSLAYHVTLEKGNTRLYGETIPAEELAPIPDDLPLPTPPKSALVQALNIPLGEAKPVYFHFVLPEDAFVAKAKSLGATPNTLMATLTQMLIRRLNPLDKRPIRVAICVNERKALGLELAHQSLVGGAVIAFDEELESLPLEEKSHRVREQFKKQIQGEPALYSFAALRGLTKMILEKPTDEKRQAFAQEVRKYANSSVSGTVSYVGKSDLGGADPYIEDFVTLTSPTCGILFELAAVHGNIFLELIQPSRDDRYAEELGWLFATLGLPYENKGCRDLDVPSVKMPWDEEK